MSETRTLELPSGRSATIRRAKVRDLLRAHRATGFSEEPMMVTVGLIAEVTQIDGVPVIYEDLLDMPAEDGLFLQAHVLEVTGPGANFPERPVAGAEKERQEFQRPRVSRD
jgi:hypothetical protein